MLFTGKNYDFPMLVNLHLLDQANMVFYYTRFVILGLISLQVLLDITWLLINLIRKEKLWFPPVLLVKVFNLAIYFFLVTFVIFFLSLLFYGQWKVVLGSVILIGLSLSYRWISSRLRLGKWANLIGFVVTLILVFTSLNIISDLPSSQVEVDKTNLLALKDFDYKGNDYDWESAEKTMFLSYDYYFCKGNQEELMTLRANCMNDYVVKQLVNDIMKEYKLFNNMYVKAGDLTDFITYYDGEYTIFVKDQMVYFLSGDIDLEDKGHQDIIKKKLKL